MRIRLGLLLGWGVAIYAVLYLAWSIFAIYGFSSGPSPKAALVALLAVLSLIAGRSLRFSSWSDIFPYSLSWALMAAGFDAATNVPLYGWTMFSDWRTWIGYALIALIPLLAALMRPRAAPLAL